MIDCSTNILQIIREHPEQVRSALGIGLNDNYMILQPISPEYENQDCIFVDNRVDDYVGHIKVYAIIGIDYEPDVPAVIDAFDEPFEYYLTTLSSEHNIYCCVIKNYSCDTNSGIFVRTRKKRFWVNAYVCDEGSELGYVEGGCYVEYGNNVTLTAHPNNSNYTVTWTDVSDPLSPVITDNNSSAYTINNITSNYTIETCFIVPPKTHTLRVFTNDGKISNLDLDKMIDGYKLGDVSVTFTLDGTEYTINTDECEYGQIRVFDFGTAEQRWINYPNNEHSHDRGIILYNVPEGMSIQLTSIKYSDTCCYINGCSDTVDYTSFKGWVKEENNENNYNALESCELHYPTYEYVSYGSENPNINATYIHSKDSLPSNVLCCDPYFIKVPDSSSETGYMYYYRNIVTDEDYIGLNECYSYEYPETSETIIVTFLSDSPESIDYFTIYEPFTSTITFDTIDGTNKVCIGINDYCNCTEYKYIQIMQDCLSAQPLQYSDLPDPNDPNNPEYVQLANTRRFYRKTQYRETGTYYISGFNTFAVKEIRGSRISVVADAYDTDSFSGIYKWSVALNDVDIPVASSFNGESFYPGWDWFKTEEFSFNVCGDDDTLTIKFESQN